MKKILLIALVLVFAGPILLSGTAKADWDEGDSYKMHYPQLPASNGFVIPGTEPMVLADDWQCTETGPVSDIHLWGWWKEDMEGPILNIHVSIHDNTGAPGMLLWERDFGPGEFTMRPYGTGQAFWYDPFSELSEPGEAMSSLLQQINIEDIDDPFIQEIDEVYWLDISVRTEAPCEWGWGTSQNHSGFPGVAEDTSSGSSTFLWNPFVWEQLDLAFVITPEPATLGLMVVSGLAVLRRRYRLGRDWRMGD